MEGEQFSLCWNNFHNNLSSGFHALLQDEDLVDVTLAAEGKYLKAHKTVLSVCSPYFKELFRVNPCKHPIVILQNVNYSALHSLLQFMYQGEVSVSQEEIPTFMRVAETLKVKGLTDNSSGLDTNGLDSSHRNSPQSYVGGDHKQFLKRRPIKKVIKPLQQLKAIETPRAMKSPPAPRSTPQIPIKQPRLDENLPTPEFVQAAINPKQEPIDPADDEFRDPTYEHMDMSSMLDTTLGEPSDSKSGFLSPTSKMHMDTSSPGTLQCVLGKRGNPRLIVDGHTFFKKSGGGGLIFVKSRKGHPVLIHNGHIYTLDHKRDNRSTWVCVKQRTLNCDGCVTTSSGPMLLSYSGHNHAQLHDVIQRLQASSCSPSPELS